MPSPRLPIATSPGRRRAPLAVVLMTVMALGGAVAGVYGTGVVLGSRIAPSTDAPSSGTGPDEEAAGRAEGATRPTGSSLPDRVDGRTEAEGRVPVPVPDARPTTVPGTDGASGSEGGGGTATPFRAMWPYATWGEVQEHVLRGDGAFSSPEESALRFAREVVGSLQITVAGVDVDGASARVDLRGGGARTLVTLERLAPTGIPLSVAPWGVVSAGGDVDLRAAPSSGGASVDATAVGLPATLAVSDRRSWRGVAAAGGEGIRLEPGPAGPAIVVALAGDPRDPSAFAARPVDVRPGAGVAGPTAPADPLAATDVLARAAATGDVAAVWDLLSTGAQASVLDWRGLAARLPVLRDRLAALGSGVPLAVTTVPTDAGSIAVVSPTAAALAVPGVAATALPYRSEGSGARLAAVEAPGATWTMGPAPDLVVAGPARPAGAALDGTPVAGEAAGERGLRLALVGVAAGDHLAVAVFVVGDVVSAAVHGFAISQPLPDTPTSEPERTDPPTEVVPPVVLDGATDRATASS